ncbi:MAG: enoyl-CoA hydratase/isomerase family protein, partial [Acidovorax defluvii]
ADIKELQNRSLAAQREGAELGQAVFALLDRLPIPSIALVNGFAFGGGCELALACTLRLALPNAKFGLPEVKLGLIPGYGGTQRLPRLVGAGRALEMVMTGRTVGAEEALSMGLVNRIVQPPGLAAAKAYAREFTSNGLRALQFARDAVQRALDVPLHEGLRMEADLSTLAYRTRDAEEGMQAFVEKRKANFRDE